MIYNNNQSKIAFSSNLLSLYVLSRTTLLHSSLPKKLLDKLPTGWNFKMFWTSFMSGGKKFYFDYPYKMNLIPPSKKLAADTIDSRFKLSDEEIKFFYENGYVGPFDFMSTEEIKEVKEHLVNLVENVESKIMTPTDYELIDAESDNVLNMARQRMKFTNRHLEDSKFLKVIKSNAILDRCAQFLGEDLIVWKSSFFNITPGSSGTDWHQASIFLYEDMKEPLLRPQDKDNLFDLTCWVALTDATKANGCLKIIPGSHKDIYSSTLMDGKAEESNSIFGDHVVKIDFPIETSNIHELEVKAGQFFIFSERTLHGSLPNKTDETRWAFNFRITKTSTKIYSENMLKNKHKYIQYGLKNMNLHNWRAVLVRGKDKFGLNRLL